MAIRTLIDWVLRDDNPDDEIQNDLDKEYADLQNDLDKEYADLQNEKHFLRDVKGTEGKQETHIFVDRNAEVEKHLFIAKNENLKDACHIDVESKFDKNNSSKGGKVVPVVEEIFSSQKAEVAQTKNGGMADCSNADKVVRVKAARLSGGVTPAKRAIKKRPDEDLRYRKPTKPEREDTEVKEVIVPMKGMKLSSAIAEQIVQKSFDVTKVYGYHQMPYLSDAATVDFIKHSHTMFIMRGLPGSGKSTLVKCLQEVYKGIVCSADDFFYDNDGTYNFDAGRLSEAHKFCQDKASYHCDKGKPVVIIDNTNIQRWSMSFYVKLAQNSCHYHVVIVEPRTPWRYDPDELAARNIHNVDRDLISKKLKSLTDNVYRPLYYGWFVCKTDSSLLVKKSREVLKQCLDEILWPDLGAEDVSDSFRALEEILNNVVICYTDPVPMLHCTAAYLARRSKDAYHTEEYVLESLGKAFSLRISGFVYSKQAISARVDIVESTCNTLKAGYLAAKSRTLGAEGNGINDTNIVAKLYMKTEEEKLRDKYSDVHLHSQDSEKKHSLFNHGCSAHITISYANDGQSKLSGENLLNILELEFYGKVKQKRSKVGLVSAYGNDMFQIQLSEPIEVKSLFQGFYSNRG
ncbi:2',3'-cyclic-nucleotide 3'-phosphodiesterase-like isoform X2 [Ruditapes philippinarum]|uniref:2',3'-cyclic-nucleotide 3'-phosphodiesterase-like isoform X2 n=1 Tax=Ruditapes philippinarum TaxID=129788 RepID=UPI00295B14C4|nr:2',3'-cyclic-nucleotide 3'-phosphodiesterase-like isoform X2 [Ruditapes philippinarum]